MSEVLAAAAEHSTESALGRSGDVLTLTFTRPSVHNALTAGMYEHLRHACEQVRGDRSIRCLVLRGISGGAFAAGTDIAHFRSVQNGDDGVAYEQSVQLILTDLLDLAVPTLAVVEGYALGGGLLIAASCDLRVCTPQARFGVPIARTVGNCLSQFGYDLLADRLGSARTLQLLLTAEAFDATVAKAAGFVLDVIDPASLEAQVSELIESLCRNAPLTMKATKDADRVRRTQAPESNTYIRACYGSADFAEGVRAFLTGQKPIWRGE